MCRLSNWTVRIGVDGLPTHEIYVCCKKRALTDFELTSIAAQGLSWLLRIQTLSFHVNLRQQVLILPQKAHPNDTMAFLCIPGTGAKHWANPMCTRTTIIKGRGNLLRICLLTFPLPTINFWCVCVCYGFGRFACCVLVNMCRHLRVCQCMFYAIVRVFDPLCRVEFAAADTED